MKFLDLPSRDNHLGCEDFFLFYGLLVKKKRILKNLEGILLIRKIPTDIHLIQQNNKSLSENYELKN